MELSDPESPGIYVGALGGGIPLDETPPLPLYLMGGLHKLTGPGGLDVGAFEANIQVAAPAVWTNRDQINSINRGSPVTFEWTGGEPAQAVIIGGVSTDQVTQATGGFFCRAKATDHRFTVPASDTANMPATGAAANLEESGGVIGMLVVPVDSLLTFTAPGVDTGIVINATVGVRTVSVQ